MRDKITHNLFSLSKVQTNETNMLQIVADMSIETEKVEAAIAKHLRITFKNCDANKSLYDVFAFAYSKLFYGMENKVLESIYSHILANFKKINDASPEITTAINMLESLKTLKQKLDELANKVPHFKDQYELSRHAYDLFNDCIQNPAKELQSCVEQYSTENKKRNPELTKLCYILVNHVVRGIEAELRGEIGSKTPPMGCQNT